MGKKKPCKPKPKVFAPSTVISWGRPPEGFYNPTELIVEPYKYRVIAHANPAKLLCPIHVK